MSAEEIHTENCRRLDILYREKNDWLMAAAYNITKNREWAKELVAELYTYIAEKGNPNIWYGADEYNMVYLHSFLRTRFINMLKSMKRFEELELDEVEDIPYDADLDRRVQETYDSVVGEIMDLQKTKMWSSARLAELYYFTPEMTLDKLSKMIGISKSTSFLNVRKIRQHIQLNKKNPFRDDC